MATRQVSDIPAHELKSLIERGIIKVMNTQSIPTRIEDTPEYKRHKQLAGQPIHVSEAERKYRIAHQTISRYAKKGIIKKLKPVKNKTMLDESYVAYVAEVYRKTKEGQGRWMFDKDGLPYITSTT